MVTQSLSHTSERGTNAVKKLREQKLRKGHPFMINASELASDLCYLEYPGGKIKLRRIVQATRDMKAVQVLNDMEADRLRSRFHFSNPIKCPNYIL